MPGESARKEVEVRAWAPGEASNTAERGDGGGGAASDSGRSLDGALECMHGETSAVPTHLIELARERVNEPDGCPHKMSDMLSHLGVDVGLEYEKMVGDGPGAPAAAAARDAAHDGGGTPLDAREFHDILNFDRVRGTCVNSSPQSLYENSCIGLDAAARICECDEHLGCSGFQASSSGDCDPGTFRIRYVQDSEVDAKADPKGMSACYAKSELSSGFKVMRGQCSSGAPSTMLLDAGTTVNVATAKCAQDSKCSAVYANGSTVGLVMEPVRYEKHCGEAAGRSSDLCYVKAIPDLPEDSGFTRHNGPCVSASSRVSRLPKSTEYADSLHGALQKCRKDRECKGVEYDLDKGAATYSAIRTDGLVTFARNPGRSAAACYLPKEGTERIADAADSVKNCSDVRWVPAGGTPFSTSSAHTASACEASCVAEERCNSWTLNGTLCSRYDTWTASKRAAPDEQGALCFTSTASDATLGRDASKMFGARGVSRAFATWGASVVLTSGKSGTAAYAKTAAECAASCGSDDGCKAFAFEDSLSSARVADGNAKCTSQKDCGVCHKFSSKFSDPAAPIFRHAVLAQNSRSYVTAEKETA